MATINLNKHEYGLLVKIKKQLEVRWGRPVTDREALEEAINKYLSERGF